MAYEPYEWQSGEAGGTPITADRLNHIEQGVSAAAEQGVPQLNPLWGEHPQTLLGQKDGEDEYVNWVSISMLDDLNDNKAAISQLDAGKEYGDDKIVIYLTDEAPELLGISQWKLWWPAQDGDGLESIERLRLAYVSRKPAGQREVQWASLAYLHDLDAKADVEHEHTIAQVEGLQDIIDDLQSQIDALGGGDV